MISLFCGVFVDVVVVDLKLPMGRFTRYDFVACDKLTTGPRHDLRLSQRFKGRFTRYDFVACDIGLRQAHDMIYDCCVRQKKCRSICDIFSDVHNNRKSCRGPVWVDLHGTTLSHATTAYDRPTTWSAYHLNEFFGENVSTNGIAHSVLRKRKWECAVSFARKAGCSG